MRNIKDLSYFDFENYFIGLGEKKFRVGQIFTWLYRKKVSSIDEMTDMSLTLREKLKLDFYFEDPKVASLHESKDGTRKLLIELRDKSNVESVLIKEGERLTLCLSTQVGCAVACTFCLTGFQGLKRNLSLSEMTGQIECANSILKENEHITNIVLMGMGEPFHNYDNVVKFCNLVTDQKAYGLSQRKVTVSTSGHVPSIERFGFDTSVSLAVSINATTDEVRDVIMPINKQYPLKVLLEALRKYPLKPKRTITIEYVLLGGLTDTEEDAHRLVKMLRQVNCKINLIPFNPFPESEYKKPTDEAIDKFWQILLKAGYVTVIRKSKGEDILAACGQLTSQVALKK